MASSWVLDGFGVRISAGESVRLSEVVEKTWGCKMKRDPTKKKPMSDTLWYQQMEVSYRGSLQIFHFGLGFSINHPAIGAPPQLDSTTKNWHPTSKTRGSFHQRRGFHLSMAGCNGHHLVAMDVQSPILKIIGFRPFSLETLLCIKVVPQKIYDVHKTSHVNGKNMPARWVVNHK